MDGRLLVYHLKKTIEKEMLKSQIQLSSTRCQFLFTKAMRAKDTIVSQKSLGLQFSCIVVQGVRSKHTSKFNAQDLIASTIICVFTKSF